MLEVKQLHGSEACSAVPALARVLTDCVVGNASVSFMLPFSQQDGEDFFTFVASEVQAGRRVLFAAFLGDELVGTVQLITSMPPNQAHRADVAKLLVLRSARSQGVASRLMETAEQWAGAHGKTLLVLDTVTGGPAEKLYVRLGWTKVGVIPNYALYPDGAWCDTTLFWKRVN